MAFIRFFIVTSFLFSLSQSLYAQSDNLIIEHYTIEQGLSTSSVNDILQNREGYLWFSTRRGVERYDGYSFHSYLNDPQDTTSFIDASASNIYEDNEGVLWFASSHGLEKYDHSTNSFKHFLPDGSKKGQVTGNQVFDMTEDHQGIFWVTTGKGVFTFDKVSGKFTKVPFATGSFDSTQSIYAFDRPLFVDRDGALWIGTSKGLDTFDYKTGELVHFWRAPENYSDCYSKYTITSICEDNNGILWLSTLNGLVEFNKKTGIFNHYLPYSNSDNSETDLSSAHPSDVNYISDLCLDPAGFLWVGTGRGIFSFDTKLKKFTPQFINNSVRDYYLGNNFIQSLYIDRSGTLWASTLADGIYKVILKELPYKRYFHDAINKIVKGENDILWVKKGLEGWAKFDTKKDQIKFLDFSELRRVYQANDIDLPVIGFTTIFFDKPNGIWFGAYQGGLYFFDSRTHTIREVVKTETYITAILKDEAGLVWAGNNMGTLICYNSKDNSVMEFISDPEDPSSFSGRTIFDIYQDRSGNLWFATEAGLNKFIPASKTFIHLSVKDGLRENTVTDILEDDHGNLWLGTNKGISKFNPKTKQFKNFDVLRGLSSSNWWNDLAVRMDNGEMFFGRSYGLIRFHPDSIIENTYIPPIVITSFRLFDKPAPLAEKIQLSYDNNFLSFEFAALNYYNTQRNQYAYKMEGVDKDWIYSGTRRYASYPNMAPGQYIFRVKGSNNDGIWNETGTSISIIISPPWWDATWAWIAYGIFFLLVLYGIRRYELNRIGLKNKIALDETILKERDEIDQVKARFFANISHEFRTPLTLIKGPAEKIISNSSDDIKKAAVSIKNNSVRLLRLVNQLLDLSRLEAGKLKLEASKGNIVSFVKGIALSFESLSEEKDITLKIYPEKDLIDVWFDSEKMIQILSNIFSNAFKFTPQNGKITIDIREKSGHVEIKVKDTGIGIAPDELTKLFDRFYQVDSSFSKEYQGTGIGLAVTKELVELHHGIINVSSESGKWTEFKLSFPLGRRHLTDEQIVSDEKALDNAYAAQNYIPFKRESKTGIREDTAKEEKNLILVVEDNYDMREYIRESIDKDYRIEEAVNGEQGVRKAQNLIPDLIISDMMMPKMDGNALTRTIKNDERTSHIPIIILTAKSGKESKVAGLETGADDYLTKPFDIEELQVRVKNLIRIRRKLQDKFSNTEYITTGTELSNTRQIKNLKLKAIDEKFITKVLQVIEDHISEESFSTEQLGDEVGMSRTQFYRKIKALTGMPASIYLRSVRLAKSKKLIEDNQGNISEIAYAVGFSSPSYFAKCFKEEFGYIPSDFIE